MPSVSLESRPLYNDPRTGAIICRTPRTRNDEVVNDRVIDNHCVLVSSIGELLYYFGDPYVNPSEYADLLLVSDLVRRGIPIYVSSVYEMEDHIDDGFSIPYNGYTEFTFIDGIGYKLKSNIKFAQPIIQSSFDTNILTLYVSLFLLNRSSLKTSDELNKLETSQLYRTYTYTFNVDTSTDEDIINALAYDDLELKIVKADDNEDDKALLNKFKSYTSLSVNVDQDDDLDYTYDVHNNKYNYKLSEDSDVTSAYIDAINRLANKKPEPYFTCLGQLFRSSTTFDGDSNIIRSVMVPLDTYNYLWIQSQLLSLFNEDCNTYLFISAPDVSSSTMISMMSNSGEFEDSSFLLEQYNCEICFGFASDFIDSSLSYSNPTKVFYTAAVLSFYNTMYNQLTYMSNAIENLNISNGCLKFNISESVASKLSDLRCNSVVTFNSGYPSIYGNRTLSMKPNLRYSNIARNFVLIRRLIREYLETRLFILNTLFTIQESINTIKSTIIEPFKSNGVINSYSVSYAYNNRTVNIIIELNFVRANDSLSLNFTI